MTGHRYQTLCRAVAVPLLAVWTAGITPAGAEDSFTGFIVGLRDVCAEDPSRVCADRVVSFLDRDNDKYVTLQELQSAHAQAKLALQDRAPGLSNVERNLLAVGVFTLEQANLEKVFGTFDADTNGKLSESELFADFHLDERPFGEILADPDSADWAAFTAHFGNVGKFFRKLLPPSHQK